jgi:CRISPR-associated exonuclease Cas4
MFGIQRMLIIVATLAVLGLVLLWLARRGRAQSGLPEGRVVYVDTGGWRRPGEALFSRRLLLTGRPDYLVDSGQAVVPVEVKSCRAPMQPYGSHVLQLAAYCLMVEERYGRRPPHGIIKYSDQSFQVEFDSRLEEALLRTMQRMRADLVGGHARRRHHDPRRCAACGFRAACGEALI